MKEKCNVLRAFSFFAASTNTSCISYNVQTNVLADNLYLWLKHETCSFILPTLLFDKIDIF